MKKLLCVILMSFGLSACGMYQDTAKNTANKEAEAASCAEPEEAQALDTRALQSDLMNAALSCGQQEHYNAFVMKFRGELQQQHALVKDYFSRLDRADAEREMTTFLTNLANRASEASMSADGDIFCQQSAALFDYILHSRDIKQVAVQSRYESMHGIARCGIVTASAAG